MFMIPISHGFCSRWTHYALWSAQFPCRGTGTRCHVISRALVSIVNSSSRTLRIDSWCKRTHKRHLWELLFKLQFTCYARFDLIWLIDWLIDWLIHPAVILVFTMLLSLNSVWQGFAVQEDTEKTIEAVLFDALLKTRLIESRATSNYHRCGRTDKGVSAFSQVSKTTPVWHL